MSLPLPAPLGTLKEALETMLVRCLRGRSEDTRRKHGQVVAWLLAFYGDGPIERFCGCRPLGYELIQRYVDAEGPDGRGCKFITVRDRLVTLSMALKEAERRGLIHKMPPWPDLPSDSKPREWYLEDCEYRDVLRQLPEPRQRYVAAAAWTGQHKRDLEIWSWAEMRLQADGSGKASLHFLRRNTKNRATPIWCKMPVELAELLEQERWRSNPLPTAPVVGRWANARRDLHAVCEELGLRDEYGNLKLISPIDLRRTCATWWAERGGDKDGLRRYLGHSGKSEMVDKVYARVTPAQLHRGVEAFERVPLRSVG